MRMLYVRTSVVLCWMTLLARPTFADYPVFFITSAGFFVSNSDGVLVAWDATSPDDPGTRFTLIDENGCALMDGDTVFLKASNGKFVTAEDGGPAFTDSDVQGDNERFTIVDVGGYGVWRGGGLIELRQASGKHLSFHDRGALFFEDSSYPSEGTANLRNADSPWPALSFTLRALPTTLTAGNVVTLLSLEPTGGPEGGTNKYSFSISRVGGGVVAERTIGPLKIWSSSRLDPGRYKIDATVHRYCGDQYILRASQTIADYEVCGVSITAPAAGQVVQPGTSQTISWTRTASCSDKPMAMAFGMAGSRVNITTVALNTANPYSWSVPANGATTAQGVITLKNPSDSLNVYKSGPFVVASGAGTPDFAVTGVTTHPALCYPSENWVEVTISSTAQKQVKATVTVKNQTTQETKTARRDLSLIAGTAKHRFTLDFPDGEPREITATVDTAESPIPETNETNNTKRIYVESIRACQ